MNKYGAEFCHWRPDEWHSAKGVRFVAPTKKRKRRLVKKLFLRALAEATALADARAVLDGGER